jgi:RNA polymerase sigma factor (sigma-70 family)
VLGDNAMEDDATLLREYATNRSDQAFAELVRRYVDLVYSAALRQVAGDAHLAEDVVQSVFTDLANKAGAVASCPVLAGWLHTSTHYAAAKVVRSEQRRRIREQQAHAVQELMNNSAQDAEWSRLRPVLDTAIRQLSAEDRDAILLRFFEGRAFAVIGERLRLTENAARMRVERSLEKLRHELARRGISSTSGALATVLISQAVTGAPLPLASSVTAAALTGTAATGAAVSLLQFMAITKTQLALTGALLLGGGGVIISQEMAQTELREELARSESQNAQLVRTVKETREFIGVDALTADSAELSRLRADVAALRANLANLTELTRQREKAARSAEWDTKLPANRALEEARQKALLLARANMEARRKAENEGVGGASGREPILLYHVPPVYPRELKQAGISGEVLVEFIVNAEGGTNGPFAVHSTRRELESAAVEAAKQWEYEPGAVHGRRVNTRVQVPFVFKAEEKDVEENNLRWF